jgi:regulator of protease activity HflC (stomatin/prohibitin superfamily)
MAKYKITNTSQKHSDGKRNIFLTEAGKLIKPGEHCLCNRLDSGTQSLVDAKILSVEEGDFTIPSIFADTAPAAKEDTSVADAAAKAEADAKANAAKHEAAAAAEAKEAALKAAADKAEAEKAAAADKPEMTKAEKKAAAKAAKENRG